MPLCALCLRAHNYFIAVQTAGGPEVEHTCLQEEQILQKGFEKHFETPNFKKLLLSELISQYTSHTHMRAHTHSFSKVSTKV